MPEKLTLKTFFEAAVEAGIRMDPRGREPVERELADTRKEFEDLTSKKDREAFDRDALTNPYVDSRILYGDPATPLKNIAVGIDIDTSEVILVDRLIERGKKIDLVVAHHPAGKAYANFYDVMKMQADMLFNKGVPINQAQGALKKKIGEISRKVAPANHNRAVDAAKLLNIPLCCMHTVADNHVDHYLNKLMTEKKPYRLEDIIDILLELPEYTRAQKLNNGPAIFAGEAKNRCGKIAFEMTGGTTGSKEAIKQLADSGIGTLVVMHIPEDYREECEKLHINIVSAGHIASDSLGLNLLMGSIRQSTGADFGIVPVSGYLHVSR